MCCGRPGHQGPLTQAESWTELTEVARGGAGHTQGDTLSLSALDIAQEDKTERTWSRVSPSGELESLYLEILADARV